MARDHILFVLDLRSQSYYQLLGHSLWTRLVGSFDFSSQFLPDLTIFLFYVLKFFFLIFEQWPSQTEHDNAAKLLSYRTSEFAIRTNESLLSQSYAITVIMAPQSTIVPDTNDASGTPSILADHKYLDYRYSLLLQRRDRPFKDHPVSQKTLRDMHRPSRRL